MATAAPTGPADTLPTSQKRQGRLWAALPYILILLMALALRLYQLSSFPPGLTHDEANHGREAIGILNGVYLYFFPLNYGSEPLYSYTVAAFMALLGRNVFALRLVNVLFGTAAIAMTAVWSAPRLGLSPRERRLASLLGAALMAVSFWPLASSREALRAGMLPFFMALAVWFFWRILETRAPDGLSQAFSVTRRGPIVWLVVGFALALVATFHIYLAARVTWLLFPVYLGYLALVYRPVFRRAWKPVLAGLGLAGLLAIPMFLYLRAHPEMQTRLGMLDGSLQQITGGNWLPTLTNARDALLAFIWPGFGDQFLAYNIPGRPVFDAVSAVFLVVGIGVCLWRWHRPVFAFLLLWFVVGIVPSLVTGPTANTTRNLAALPAVYLIAAVGFAAPAAWLWARLAPDARRWGTVAIGLLAVVWIGWAGWQSANDYFVRWGQSPAVRGAYQHTLAKSLDYLAVKYPAADPLIFSSVYPGPAHDSSVALVLAADRPAVTDARWVDARYALIIPESPGATVIIPASTPPHPAFIPLLNTEDSVTVAATDLDPGFTINTLDVGQVQALVQSAQLDAPVNFGGAAELIGARWLTDTVEPEQTAELLTVWRVLDPALAGPLVPPSFTTDIVAFTHVLNESGEPITQRDSLDAPSWAWQRGDLILQIHPVTAPAEPGTYATEVGLYDRTSLARLPVIDDGGSSSAEVTPLVVSGD